LHGPDVRASATGTAEEAHASPVAAQGAPPAVSNKPRGRTEGKPATTPEDWDRVEADLNRRFPAGSRGFGHYDRQGKPIGLGTWARRFHDENYKRILATQLSAGIWVSTVWMGLDHGFGRGPPIIFETMVFRHDDASGEEQYRYATEAEAREGHALAVARYLAAGHEPIDEFWGFRKIFAAERAEFEAHERLRRTLAPLMRRRA
jgi:hypothetical protein